MKARIENPLDGFDKKTQKAVTLAATNEFNQQKQMFLDALMNVFLWTLHEEFGFGYKRMRRFYYAVFKRCYLDREKYELVGSSKYDKPMSPKLQQKYAENGWTYPDFVKYRLSEYGWDTNAIEAEFKKEYDEKGGF